MEDTEANTPTSPEEIPANPEPASEAAPVAEGAAPAAIPEAAIEITPADGDDTDFTPAEPEPTPDAAEAPAGQAASSDDDPLTPLMAKSAVQRLSAPEEEQAVGLIRDRLLGKKEEFAGAVALLPKLGWAVSSKAVGSAWPTMKATAKTALMKTLASEETDASRRIRLSIGRALFKLPDIAASLKLVVGVAKEIRDKETAAISPKDAQSFANVMIGKGKPWIAQIPLADAKPADIDLLVHAAIYAAFLLNQPPVTQIGVLKWAAEAGRLEKLHEGAVALAGKGIGRMSGKWQSILRKEIAELPEPLAACLRPVDAEAPAPAAPAVPRERDRDRSSGKRRPAPDEGLPAELRAEPSTSPADTDGGAMDREDDDREDEDDDDDELEGEDRPAQKERPVYVSKTIPPKEPRAREPRERGPESRSSERPERPERPERGERSDRVERSERPPNGPSQQPAAASVKGPPARSPQFNATDVLRQLETHINFLRTELKTAETKLRSREDDRRLPKRKLDVPVVVGEPTLEELVRLNLQLESRIAELQARIDDLTADAEARAVSSGAFEDSGVTSPEQQLRTLLALKLQEAYADFNALEQEDRDIVVQQHYRTVLREVFEVLKLVHVPLDAPVETPAS